MKTGILRFPGSCDEVDAQLAAGLDGELWQHWGFQVRVRAKDHPVGTAKVAAIRKCLAEQVYHNQVSLGSSRYLVWCVAKISAPMWINKDVPGSKRSIFTLNALAAITAR